MKNKARGRTATDVVRRLFASGREVENPQVTLIADLAVVVFILVSTLLLVLVAYRLSLWGDELDTVDPAFRPWSGPGNFWAKIRDYNANPPGDNFVERLLWQSPRLHWIYQISEELFWRMPHVLLFGATLYGLYRLSRSHFESAFLGFVVFAWYAVSPGPLNFAVEARFYAWALFFMTLSVWLGLRTINKGFSLGSWFAVSLATFMGVGFHVALALNCYVLMWFSLYRAGRFLWVESRKRKVPNWIQLIHEVGFFFIGVAPYLFFKYEKHHWIFLPGGKGAGAVFWASLSAAFSEIPKQLGESVWPTRLWQSPLMMMTLAALLVWKGAWSIRRRLFNEALGSFYLVILLFGGAFALLLSCNANGYYCSGRNYLFAVPVLMASVMTLIPVGAIRQIRTVPTSIAIALIGLVFLGAVSVVLDRSFSLSQGSPTKVNFDFGVFRREFEHLPDRKPLIVVGGGSGDLWAATDGGSYIGGAHIYYTKAFHPRFLSTRTPEMQRELSRERAWGRYDYLVIISMEQAKEKFPQIPWKDAKCSQYSIGTLSFCRITR